MSRFRFKQILTYLHFADNENISPNEDRLAKVRPIVEYFLAKFKNIYKPKQNLSLDKGIIPWIGRLIFAYLILLK